MTALLQSLLQGGNFFLGLCEPEDIRVSKNVYILWLVLCPNPYIYVYWNERRYANMSTSSSEASTPTRKTQRAPYHEVIYQCVAMECGTLEVFLRAMGDGPVVVSLMSLSRSIAVRGGEVSHLFAVHLTYRGREDDHPVYYATFIAAKLTGLGISWKLTYPYEDLKLVSEQSGLARARQLADELVQALLGLLDRHSSVSNVLVPSRFRLPDEFVWGVSSSAAESGVCIRDHHWSGPEGGNKREGEQK